MPKDRKSLCAQYSSRSVFDNEIVSVQISTDSLHVRNAAFIDSGFPKFESMMVNPILFQIRAMYNGSRRDFEETSDFTLNPDPVPYQPSNFM